LSQTRTALGVVIQFSDDLNDSILINNHAYRTLAAAALAGEPDERVQDVLNRALDFGVLNMAKVDATVAASLVQALVRGATDLQVEPTGSTDAFEQSFRAALHRIARRLLGEHVTFSDTD